jgi:cysteine-rich repeat protein
MSQPVARGLLVAVAMLLTASLVIGCSDSPTGATTDLGAGDTVDEIPDDGGADSGDGGLDGGDADAGGDAAGDLDEDEDGADDADRDGDDGSGDAGADAADLDADAARDGGLDGDGGSTDGGDATDIGDADAGDGAGGDDLGAADLRGDGDGGSSGGICGDGTVDPGRGEDCDDGNRLTESCDYGDTSCLVCDRDCNEVAGATSYCGDGSVDAANDEDCDDSNAVTEACPYGERACTVCRADCTEGPGLPTFCGDGAIDGSAGETCDDGNDETELCEYGELSCTVCAEGCLLADGEASFCGDGDTDTDEGETCDDGNVVTELCEYGETSCTVCGGACQLQGGRTSYCGDARRDFPNGEDCDDGNTVTEACPYDIPDCTVCDEVCKFGPGIPSTCGDGTFDSEFEECDDGNNVTEPCAYGETACTVCDRSCDYRAGTTSFCGDSRVDGDNGETCDDGNDETEPCLYGDRSCEICQAGCTLLSLTPTYCGDSVVDGDNGETCDDGNDVTEACDYGDTACNICSETCNEEAGATSFCGDSVVDGSNGETCDDGNAVTETCDYGDTSCSVCNAVCAQVAGATSYCGDGAVDGSNGETCDDGNAVTETCRYGQASCSVCDALCAAVPGVTSYCGDSAVDHTNGEECDDGNAIPGDGCSLCRIEHCGDGFLATNESCDDGNAESGDGCSAACRRERCGDGLVQPGEQCDDGNDEDGDGCDGECLVECDDDEFEDNDTALTAYDAGDMEFFGGATLCGDDGLGFTADAEDWYEMEVTTPGDWLYVRTRRSGDTACADQRLRLEIYDVAGTLVEAAASHPWDCPHVAGRDLAPGIYRIVVRSALAGRTPASQEYLLTADIGAPECGDGGVDRPWEQCDDGDREDGDGCSADCLIECADDLREDDDTPAQATSLASLPARVESTLCASDDAGFALDLDVFGDPSELRADMYAVSLAAGEELVASLATFGTLLCQQHRLGLALLDAAGELVDYEVRAPSVCAELAYRPALPFQGTLVVFSQAPFEPQPYALEWEISRPECGDGTVEGSEQCDDGDLTGGDGCDRNCFFERCDNGIVQAAHGEECDDGNRVDGDGCDHTCLLEEQPLYVQDNGSNPAGTSSWSFPVDPTKAHRVADDFVVPDGQMWYLRDILFYGLVLDGGFPRPYVLTQPLDVRIYADDGGLPGALVVHQPAASYSRAELGGFQNTDIIAHLDPVLLPPGRYWISPQLPFSQNPGWYWQHDEGGVVTGGAAAFWNPDGGLGVGCTEWTHLDEDVCGADIAADMRFEVRGVRMLAEVERLDASVTSSRAVGYLLGTAEDAELAVDFTIDGGAKRQIRGVFLPGGFLDSLAATPEVTSVVVTLYRDAEGAPGVAREVRDIPLGPALRLWDTGRASSGLDDAGFTILLDPPVELTSGSYWLSVQPRLDSSDTEDLWQWGMTPSDGTQSQERRSFGATCLEWSELGACGAPGDLQVLIAQ